MAKRKSTKGQTTIYKTLDRNLKTNPTENRGVNSGNPEGLAVLASHMTSVVLLLTYLARVVCILQSLITGDLQMDVLRHIRKHSVI